MCEKILLSHSSKDSAYGDAIVTLLLRLGLHKQQILYSSNPNLGIPIGYNIFGYLRDVIQDGAYVIYLLSDNYYNSIACMNEMGAAWIRQNDSLLIAIPGFDFKNERFQSGAANPRDLAFQIDNMTRMYEFAVRMIEMFQSTANDIQIQSALQDYFITLDRIKKEKADVEKKDPTITHLETIVRQTPAEASAFLALGEALWARDKNYPAAIQQFLYAIYLDEHCADAYNQLVLTATEKKQYTLARKVSDEAIRRFPNNAMAYGNRGHLACNEKNYEEAIECCIKAISLWEYFRFYNTLGRSYLGQGKLYLALESFWKSHKLNPQYPHAITNIKIVCNRLGINTILATAREKLAENKLELCQKYLECILLADETNKTAKELLNKLNPQRAL